MLKNKFSPLKINNPALRVGVFRGTHLESQHQVHMVIVNASGEICGSYGNPDFLTFPRSAIKPLQALAFVSSGALEKFSLTSRHLALACASHRGEPQHTELAAQWLKELSLDVNNFCCGAHPPGHTATYEEMIRRRESPSALHNNCSGKHLGILSACLSHGWDCHGYYKYDHPFQKELRLILSETMQWNHDFSPWGIDGCGIPSYAVPLKNLALGISAFLKPTANWLSPLQQISNAMIQHPELIAGTGELVSILMKAIPGKILLKNGAEGVFAGAVLDSPCGEPLAFAIKCEDGSGRGASVAATEFLLSQKVFSESEEGATQEFLHPLIKNWAGESVGHYCIE